MAEMWHVEVPRRSWIGKGGSHPRWMQVGVFEGLDLSRHSVDCLVPGPPESP